MNQATATRQCYYCGKSTDRLCDRIIEHLETGTLTCDRPICDEHRKRVGTFRACKRGRGGHTSVHTIDHCTAHYEEENLQ